MQRYANHDVATSNALAWSAHAANVEPSVEEDAGADVDEPPDQLSVQTVKSATKASFQEAPDNICHSFLKTVVQRPRENVESLLTKALQSQSEDEPVTTNGTAGPIYPRRRPSVTSNTSLASTAGFTSDTGITTPPRTNSPSPRILDLGLVSMHYPHDTTAKSEVSLALPAIAHPPTAVAPLPATQKIAFQETACAKQGEAEAPVAPPPARKRFISFACANPSKQTKPGAVTSMDKPRDNDRNPAPGAVSAATHDATATASAASKQPPAALGAQPKRPCIRFACSVRPPPNASQKPQLSALKTDGLEGRKLHQRKPSPAPVPRSPTSLRKFRVPSSSRSPRTAARSSDLRLASRSPLAVRSSKKYITAEPDDLKKQFSQFHEFASDVPLEDDWIHNDKMSAREKITINDTLKKEMAIRLLGKEAEEEAEQEERDEDEENEDEEDEDNAEDEGDEDEDEDDEDDVDTVEEDDKSVSGYGSDDDISDGYNTDNEIGFASSDDEDDGLVLWTTGQSRVHQENHDYDHTTLLQGGTPVFRRLSIDEHSDSSGFVAGHGLRQGRPKNMELNRNRMPPPELPDSTDFVCGTFDEDRPLEEAYLSHIRKRGKKYVIPQDIDPSFPTSDPEDESENDSVAARKQRTQKYQPHQGSADDQLWLHGELEDLHHDHHDSTDAKRRVSPRRYHSPPPTKRKGDSPRRYHSPPPKNRGRSPAPRLFDRRSLSKRLKSPAPLALPLPIVGQQVPIDISPPASLVDADTTGNVAFQALAFRPGLTQALSLPRRSAVFRHPNQHVHHVHHTHHHPTQTKSSRRSKTNVKPVHIRSAIDIVKGLEQKRQRRKVQFQQKYCNRARKGQVPERRPQRGEGAERMREIGLIMAGKIGQGNYVLSI